MSIKLLRNKAHHDLSKIQDQIKQLLEEKQELQRFISYVDQVEKEIANQSFKSPIQLVLMYFEAMNTHICKVSELLNWIEDSGLYKSIRTKSNDWKNVIYAALYNNKEIFISEKKGVWRLVKSNPISI